MPGPWSRTSNRQAVVGEPRRDVDGRAWRRVLRGVLQQMRQRRGGQPRIEPHRHVGSMRRRPACAAAACARPGRAPPRRSPTDAPSATRWRPRRRRCAPSRGCSGTAGSGARPRTRIRSLCSRSSVGRQRRRLDIAGRDANGRERRAQIVAERRQQRRLQLLALARQLAALRSSRNCARSIAIATTPASVSSVPPRPAGRPRRAGRSAWCRRAAAPAGRRGRRRPSSGGRRRSGRRRRTRASSGRRRTPWSADARSSAIVRAPASKTSQSSPRGSAMATNSRSNRRAIARASIDERLAAVGDHQHVAAQVEQPRQLVAPPDRLLGPGPRHRRQVAGHQADGEKREQRHPVLRIGDGERADRRQEEEVEAQHRRDRRHDGDPQARRGGDQRARPSGRSSRRSPRSTTRSQRARTSVTAPTREQPRRRTCRRPNVHAKSCGRLKSPPGRRARRRARAAG